jgi:hemoglobin
LFHKKQTFTPAETSGFFISVNYKKLNHEKHSNLIRMGRRQRWVHLLLQTADEVGLKSDPEFRSAFIGYLEWGTRIAVINSQLTENPMQNAEPMPKWGWGETGGPYVADAEKP